MKSLQNLTIFLSTSSETKCGIEHEDVFFCYALKKYILDWIFTYLLVEIFLME